MTYYEFERELYKCDTILEIVRLCVENNALSRKFVERQDWLAHIAYEHVFKGRNEIEKL